MGADRRPQYKTETVVVESEEGRLVEKTATDPAAIPFLSEILEREAIAERFYGEHAITVRGKLEGERIVYPFIDHPTIEDRIRERICAGASDSGLSEIERYLAFLDRLPQTRRVPTAFCEQIGAPPPDLGGPVRCFAGAPADCIPRNIFVDDDADQWYVIDHEWMYECPMPVDLLVCHAICMTTIGLQPEIQANVSASTPISVFSGYFRERFLPTRWLPILRGLEIPLEVLNGWYECRQRQNLARVKKRRLRVGEHHEPYDRLPQRTPSHVIALAMRGFLRGAQEKLGIQL